MINEKKEREKKPRIAHIPLVGVDEFVVLDLYVLDLMQIHLLRPYQFN